MRLWTRCLSSLLSLCLLSVLACFAPAADAQAYVGKPKLIVIVVIDQFRGDYLNRDHAEFKGRGFRLFTDDGAWFTDCYFDYANTKTAPGHATIGTGAYTDGHGIEANEWWDASRSNEVKVSSGAGRALQAGGSAGIVDSREPAGSRAMGAEVGRGGFALEPAGDDAGR